MARLLFDLFKKSPFGPLHDHMVKVRECVEFIRPLFEAVLAGRTAEAEKIVKKISKAEHKADVIKNKVRQSLPSGIFLPVNREDLLAYLKVQDDIADSVEDVSILLTLKKLNIPDSLHAEIFAFVDKVLEVFQICDEAERELKRLVESAFGDAKRVKLLEIVGRAEHAEWEADKIQMKAAKKLFSLEEEMSSVDMMLVFRAFGELGKVANHAEKTGDRIRRLMIKN